MSREARRTHKNFRGEIGKTWWGYLLPAIPCQDCHGENPPYEIGKPWDGCPTCDGEGKVYPEVQPPAYPVDELPGWIADTPTILADYGWQMWETTSEGSPLSPVMDSPEELARWLADNGASAFGGQTATYEQWLSTVQRGWAVSAVMSPAHGFESGVAALSRDEATS